MTVVRLPDGSERNFDQPVTILDVATSIGPGLARAAIAGKINGKLVDLSTLIISGDDVNNWDPERTWFRFYSG
mgnify:CR=1 FL=1